MTPEQKYYMHRNSARARNIDFLLSFEQWWEIWLASGKWDQRGRCNGQYVMSRLGPDIGPYAAGNVVIQTVNRNATEKKQRAWNTGKTLITKKPVTINGINYLGAEDASKQLGIHRDTLRYRLKQNWSGYAYSTT